MSSAKRVLVVVGAILALGAIAVAWVATYDLRPLAERYVSARLDRTVTIGGLRIGWGDPLGVELSDLQLANRPGGSVPQMLRADTVTAEVELWPLVTGQVRLVALRAVRPAIVLERDSRGVGNWRFGTDRTASPDPETVAEARRRFPMLRSLEIRDGEMVYRGRGNLDLRLHADTLTAHAEADNRPIALTLTGTYNGTPGRVTIDAGSFAQLRDGSAPFPARIAVATAASSLAFDGTLTDLLGFDGIQGALRLDSRTLSEALALLGLKLDADLPVQLAGAFTKRQRHWELSGATGSLATSTLTGTITLEEAGPAEADDLGLALDVDRLDADRLLAGVPGSGAVASLEIDRAPGTILDLRLTAKQVIYGRLVLADARLDGHTRAGMITVDTLSVGIAGGRLEASATADAAGPATHLAGRVGLAQADAVELLRLAGGSPGQIAGRFDAGMTAELTGRTAAEGLASMRGQLVLAMTDGRISRDLIEKAATDLRTFFRRGQGIETVRCLLGIADLRNGAATVAPLRLRTAEATLAGSGVVDLARRRLDLTVQAEGGPSLFALHVPIRITGPLDKPAAEPALSAPRPGAGSGAAIAARLAPELRPLAERNPCLR